MKTKYIIYRRVSTKKQGESGLGLEAQTEYTEMFFKSYCKEDHKVIGNYVDTTSAKGMLEDRPILNEVVQLAKETGATILVAKLDRLSRDVELIAHLIKNVNIKVACMPHADKFQLHLYAAVAEQEREFISNRTKEALKQAKARGTVLGGYRGATKKRNETNQLASYRIALKYKKILHTCRTVNKMSWEKTADMMNSLGCKTPQGGTIYANTASRYWALLEKEGKL